MSLENAKSQKAKVAPETQFKPARSYLILAFFVLLTLGVTYLIYWQVQQYFHDRLQERLISIASTAAVNFDPSELDEITGPESVGTPVYEKIVKKLQAIREKNDNLKFIYILRETEDKNTLIFVADADSLDPNAEIDLNKDGIIDETDELNTPGDPYDVTDFPLLRDFAFSVSTVDEELAVDQWGTFLSASAPIQNEQGLADEIIGIDVEVSDYTHITNLAFVPFALFVAFLLLVLIAQTKLLVTMWSSRVTFLNELDKQKDELLSIVSHQLATPISSVKWYLEMLADGDMGKLNKKQVDHITSMMSLASNLSDLVSMILDVSRFQLGRMKVDCQEFDMLQLTDEIMTAIVPKAIKNNVDLEKNIPKSLPKVSLDKRLMRMTIENLLSNAVKYTPNGGRVSFSIEKQDKQLYFKVKDTGCGIPKGDQEKIFGKLFRASNTKNIDGNGFGLYVAKGAIEAQGGKIWFESFEGKGTTFHVRVPIKAKASE